jgi:serine/threonine protein kinase/Tol biopolymer transport system component
MTVQPGARLGIYEVTAPLGAGGMGEVYRAKDTKLGRDVALKILPASFTNDPERVARFRREAQVLASLNHPHIAQIHGLDEADGTQFLVLELVDGESLDKRIARGRIPVEEALTIAKQIAEALEAAHERGIIHRDLKPANIALTRDGNVKVLDFGLAKAVETPSGTSVEAMNSPTITTPAMMTGVGVILGTAAYMSPEQAKGRAADRRSDVWAFGCVLYEMLTGKRAFGGQDVADTLAHVLTKGPDWAALPMNTPATLRTLLHRCLSRDRRARLDSAAAGRLEIDDALAILQRTTTERVDDPRRAIRLWRTLTAIAFGVLVILAGVTSVDRLRGARSPSRVAPTVVVFSVSAPEDSSFGTIPVEPHPAVSPDGRRVAFVATRSDGTRLIWIRDLDTVVAQPLAGTSGATGTPFWSPDGRFVSFFALGQLKKIRSTGGPPETLCDAAGGIAGTWSPRGDILFAVLDGEGLRRVSASGGRPEFVTQLDRSREETSHRYPQFLPDGRHFLYLVRSARAEHRGSFVGSLDSRDRMRVLADDTAAMYERPASPTTPGYLVFVRDTTLIAQPFDADRLELNGEAEPVAPDVPVAPTVRKAPFSVAGSTLVYRSEDPSVGQLMWVDRGGKALGTVAGPELYQSHRLSPDGRNVVCSLIDRQTHKTDLWMLNLSRGIRTRLTSDPGEARSPVWSPDENRVAFISNRSGAWTLYTKELTAGVREELLFKSEIVSDRGGNTYVQQWSSDGRWIVFSYGDLMTGGIHLWALSLETRKPVSAVAADQFNEDQASLSPDSRWIAYTSDESGVREIYIQRFPNAGRKLRVSVAGGREPQWRGDGKELFFVASDGTLMATPIRGDEPLDIGTPRALFSLGPEKSNAFSQAGHVSSYDAKRDGQRFLIERLSSADVRSTLTVLVNWTAALKKRNRPDFQSD